MRNILFPALIFQALIWISGRAHCEEPGSIDGLIKCSDVVVRGKVIGSQATSGGTLHDFQVAQSIWGDPPGILVKVFTLKPALPDAPFLQIGEECIVGIRWIDESVPAWAARLAVKQADTLTEETTDARRHIGALTTDGKLVPRGREDLAQEVSTWIRVVRAGPSGNDLEAAASKLLDHESTFLRRSAVDALTEARGSLQTSTVDRLRHLVELESTQRRDTPCLLGCINLMALRNISDPSAKAPLTAYRAILNRATHAEAGPSTGPEKAPCLARACLERLKHKITPPDNREDAR